MRPRIKRTLRWLALLLASSALLVLLLSTGLWWWSGTEGSLGWVLQRVSRTQPMVFEGVRGSLRSGLYVQRLTWDMEGLQVEAFDVRLEWQPVALITRTIHLREFRAARLRVTDRRPATTDPLRRPESISLPYRVSAQLVEIGRIEWVGSTQWQADRLAGAYGFDGLGHQLRLDGLELLGGRWRGNASVGALGAMPVKATVQGTVTTPVPESQVALPMTLEATVEGPLAQLEARAVARVTGEGATPAAGLPHATATARITPFTAQPIAQARAELRRVDLAALWPQAPHTLLSGQLSIEPAAAGVWRWRADFENAAPKPWDEQGLPVRRASGHGQWRGGTAALVQELKATLGGGELEATGQWQDAQDWTLRGSVRNVDPAALHTRLAALPLGGRLLLKQEREALAFELDLRGDGAARRPTSAQAAPKRGTKTAALAPIELRQLTAQGRWAKAQIELPQLDVRTSDATLQGSLRLTPATWAGGGKLRLEAPGLAARADGELAERSGRGTMLVDARDLARAHEWLRRLPEFGRSVPGWPLAGRAEAQLQWNGGWRDPAIKASVTAPMLAWEAPGAEPLAGRWSAQDIRFTADGRLSDAQLQLRGLLQQGTRRIGLELAGRGGRSGGGTAALWRAQLPQLNATFADSAINTGAWRLQSTRAIEARWITASSRLEVGAGEALLTAPTVPAATPGAQAKLTWEPLLWGGGQLQTVGRLSGLPMAWIELLGGPQLAGAALSGDMVFDAQWNANLGDTLRVNATLERRSGDVTVLAETADGGAARVPAGVREARVTLVGQNEQVTVNARWDSERAGRVDAQLASTLVRGGPAGWQWLADAPLRGTVQARLPRIGVWSLLAPPGWRLRGSLAADVTLAGTRGQPRLEGTLDADELALRSVVEGVELRNGRLRARLAGERLLVDEFILHGTGEGVAEGSVVARGEGVWTASGLQLQATAQLNKLRASIRADRDLTVSGELSARLDATGTDVQGKLRVDRARIELPQELPPQLGDDVVVRQSAGRMATPEERKQREPERPPAKREFNLAVNVDLGPDFQLRGRGLETRLAGELAVTGKALAQPRLSGVVRAVGGQYRAYGQRLEIERGELRFTGALDNPALDILALRPNLTQRVGVMITGNVQSPFIRLYSEPDMADAEKLNWLITGRAVPSGGAESALVQQAALTLLTHRRGGAGGGLASRVGLDELGVRRDSTEGAVVTLGKRFSRNFYATYERSLSGALGTLYIFYDISRRLTLRAEAGERAAVDLIYTFSFDRILK